MVSVPVFVAIRRKRYPVPASRLNFFSLSPSLSRTQAMGSSRTSKSVIRETSGCPTLTPPRTFTWKKIAQRVTSKGRKLNFEYNYYAPRTFPISYEGIPPSGTAMARYAPPGEVPNNKEEYRNYPAYVYITNVAIVEVGEMTGAVEVKNVITAVDVGKALNPKKIEGQVEGRIMMGMGYALSEKFEIRGGISLTDQLRKCGLPTIQQTPEMITLLIEDPDPGGPYGAKGISEVATVAITPAIINAIYQAVGVRIYDLPATRDKILKGLA